MKGRDLTAACIMVVVASVVSCAAATQLPFLRLAQNWVNDVQSVLFNVSEQRQTQIVIVSIDEQVLSQMPYRSPIDRGFLRHVVQSLLEKSPRAIGLDILLDQPTEPEKDAELLAVLQASPVPIVVAWAATEDGLSAAQSDYLERFTTGLLQGHVRMIADPIDGKIRNVLINNTGTSAQPLGFAARLAVIGGDRVAHRSTMRLDLIRSAVDAGPLFASYPAHSVDVLPDEWFRDKYVLIGVDLPHSDRHSTALSVRDARLMAGVEIHAQALAQLLEHRNAPVISVNTLIAATFLLAIVGQLIAALLENVVVRCSASIVVVLLTWVAAFLLYDQSSIALPLIAPTLAFIVSTGLAQAYFRREERQQKRYIRGAFEKFLAPAYVRELASNPQLLGPINQSREISALFTDIAGFTSLVDALEPEVFGTLLNEYLDESLSLVMEMGGTVDKVVGDAIHAMFNAPRTQADHVERAVRCALALDAFSEAFVANKRRLGITFGHTRIGVNTGPATVGNFGGSARFDYTAHGTTVNMAARLESVNKQFGTRICVSQAVQQRCPSLPFRPIGDVVLVGLSEPVTLYEALNDTQAGADAVVAYIDAYSSLKGEDVRAPEIFSRLADRYPHDPLIAYHHRRLERGDSGTLLVLKEK